MKSTVTLDKTGRTVLPLQLRNQFGLGTGAELELRVKSDEIVLRLDPELAAHIAAP